MNEAACETSCCLPEAEVEIIAKLSFGGMAEIIS